jgi:hypothetical protein
MRERCRAQILRIEAECWAREFGGKNSEGSGLASRREQHLDFIVRVPDIFLSQPGQRASHWVVEFQHLRVLREMLHRLRA